MIEDFNDAVKDVQPDLFTESINILHIASEIGGTGPVDSQDL